MEEALNMAYCKRHPKIETVLACGKCGDFICPKCMVETPVGARCPKCARLSRVPTYQVSGKYYLRASGAALGAAILGGVVWGFVSQFLGFFTLLLAAAIGYGIGELISLSVNRKSGTGLAILGALAVVISYIISTLIQGIPFFSLIHLLALAIAIFVSVARLR
jgi:hypothetical protein